MSKMDGNKVHTSIVIELANQEEPEYQKAYQIDFGDLDIPRDYVIDQIFCGENVTVYAVFQIADDVKSEKQFDELNCDIHGDYRIYREKSSRKLLSSESFCKFLPEVRSKDDMKLPSTKSRGVLYRIPREKHNSGEEEKEFDTKNLFAPGKISLGTNTSMAKFTPLFYDKDEVQDNSEFKSVKVEKENETIPKAEGLRSQPKEKSKNAILREIKKLQKKINSLIRTIESSDLDFDDFEISGGDTTSFEDKPKKLERGFILSELEPSEKEQKKLDEIPIFSPLTYQTIPRRAKTKKRTNSATEAERHEIPVMLTRSVSLLSFGSSTTQIIISGEKSDAMLRKTSSDCSINWHDFENWRVPGLSKSEMLKHTVLLDPKYNVMKGVRKSLSLELRDDKLEFICLKKIKNFPFKLDGSLKSKGNMRILPKLEPSLRDSLPLLNCEMGDEASKKTKPSKVDLLGLVQVCDKQNALSFEKINLTPNKKLKEEGDAKMLYPKKNLPSTRFSRNNAELEVHFCTATNNTASDGVIKIEKNLQLNKLKLKSLEHGTDPALKICSDSEKPATPVRSCRKTYATASEVKKEAKLIKKSNKKKPRNNFEKTDGKDVSLQEPIRPKSVISNRKHSAKGYPESKIQVDKPGKPDPVSNQKTSHSAKYSEEKSVNKIDRLPRLIYQKREAAETSNDCVDSKEAKECKTLKKNSTTVNSSYKQSIPGLTNDKAENLSPAENEHEKTSDKKKGQTSQQQPPSVVVELFSQKPDDIVSNQVRKESSSSKQNPEIDVPSTLGIKHTKERNSEDSDEFKKPVVKSLWALTKLILFEDGTQKLEILEASLNPPEWV